MLVAPHQERRQQSPIEWHRGFRRRLVAGHRDEDRRGLLWRQLQMIGRAVDGKARRPRIEVEPRGPDHIVKPKIG